MKKRLFILPLLTLIFINGSFSQDGITKSAKKKYDNLSYIKTTEQLLEEANEGNRSPELLQSLANSFYFNGKMEEATKWYEELMALNVEGLDPEYYFRYSQALKGTGDYNKANTIMLEFKEMKPEDSRSKLFHANYLHIIENRSDDFKMKNLEINTSFSDFGTSVFQENLVFASSRGKNERLYNWNEQPFLDIYQLNSDGTASEIKGDINTKYHESSTAFTKDGKTVYFTRNNFYKGKFKKNTKNIHGLKIYKAELIEGEWTNIEPLPFNSDEYNVAHPTLNVEETKLYFSSDMDGTMGASDIFVVDINADGTYGGPVNLGSKINTEGRENFPFISNEGTLYFSSDGHPGLGGLDVFSFKNIDRIANSFNKAVNVGKPINSPKDDFEYIINETTLNGYISSNREGGKGDDDIYSFTRNPYMQIITGIIVDKNTNQIIADADVVIYNNTNEVAKTLKSDANGEFSIKLPLKKSTFKSQVNKEAYIEHIQDFVIDPERDEIIALKLGLEPKPEVAEIGTDLFEVLELKPVYFDYDKSSIRPDAKEKLTKVIDYMKAYPTVKLDVRSHTDSRGNNAYNLILSNKRTQSVLDYIINIGGIDKDRLTGKGYGKTKLTNKCSRDVKCSEEEHQINRRSDFIVTEN
ncbi:OmpA family protein [Flavivirga aquimarina]|uniref:OmpA family protein n=1 Tax=Flavivirga aquimarina TaxID=2027862 RepID=A0ABT8W5V0_9FLAO|nr:OmpA family protein [Flavivirga aquimarina]MDO5968488.1 OmpA family protein [Flavivirga aquimarina]